MNKPRAEASDSAINAEPEPSGLRPIPSYVALQTGPDTQILVAVKGMTIERSGSLAVEKLELDWDKKTFELRGVMEHVEALDAVFLKRDQDEPTKVAKEWRHPQIPTRVREDITFEQPWCDPEHVFLLFSHFNLTPADKKLYADPAEREKVVEQLGAEALADLEATRDEKKPPSAEKTYVKKLSLSHVGAGEEILVKKKQRGLFASKKIREGFQFLGWYAMAEMTETQLEEFLKKHGYTEKEAQAYGLDMKVPLEGHTRAEQEQTHKSHRKRGCKKPKRALISGTAIGGGNKLAFANTATKEAKVPGPTRQKKGVRYKTRRRAKVTDRSRLNAFFMLMVIPFIDNGERKLTVGMGMIGYKLKADQPVLVDYGPAFVAAQLNTPQGLKEGELENLDAEMSNVRIKEEPSDEDTPMEGMDHPVAQGNKRWSTAEQMASLVKRQRRNAEQPSQPVPIPLSAVAAPEGSHGMPLQEGEAGTASAQQLEKPAQMDMDWSRVRQSLQMALDMPDLGVSQRENQEWLRAGYAHHTANGTTSLTGEALQELEHTSKLLASLEREGWDMPAWINACRTLRDWNLVELPQEMLMRWGVSGMAVIPALSRMSGETRIANLICRGHFMPAEAANIALFRDEKFLRGFQGLTRRGLVFGVLKWLEKGEHPVAGLQGPQPPCSSLREWMEVDDEIWKERCEAYASAYTNLSPHSMRSLLNGIRRTVCTPAPLSEAALAVRRYEETWNIRIPGFTEVKNEVHRSMLKNFYHELVEQESLRESPPPGSEPDDPESRKREAKKRETKRKNALSRGRGVLKKIEEKDEVYADWVGRHLEPFGEGLEGEALYKQLMRPLQVLVNNPYMSQYRPFFISATAGAAAARQNTSVGSSAL